MGRWEPSKYFILEICKLQDIYSYNLLLAPIFYWTHFLFFKKFQTVCILYLSAFDDNLLEFLELNSEEEEDDFEEMDDFDSLKLPEFPVPEIKLEEDSLVFDNLNRMSFRNLFLRFNDYSTFNNFSYNLLLPYDYILNSEFCLKLLTHNAIFSVRKYSFLVWSVAEFDCWVRCITLHIIRSYVLKFIEKPILEFLFTYAYDWVPPKLYDPWHFSKRIISLYFQFKLALLKRFNSDFTPSTLLSIQDVGIKGSFFEHFKLDRWLPWVDFTYTFDFVLKSFFYNFNIISTNRCIMNNYSLIYTNHSYFTSQFLLFYYDTTSFLITNNFFFEELFLNFTLSSDFFFKTVLIDQNSLDLSLSYFQIISNQIILNNDNYFFDSIFFINLNQKNESISFKKQGRPKKIEIDYFDSEVDIFDDYSSFFNLNLMIFRKKIKYLLAANRFYFSVFKRFLLNIFVGLIKPF